MKNLLMFAIVAALMAGCKCPLKEKCCKTSPAVKSTQMDANYEAQRRQIYKFETRKVSITTEPSAAEIYQITDSEKLKYLGKSPLEAQPVTVLTGICDGVAFTGDVMSHLSRFGSVRVIILKEGYNVAHCEFSIDPNESFPYKITLNKKPPTN
jgi:hypothetical protein